tara:strand:+ start:202 stop:570 length:369 start_codon:yes stop_codon:yes gene_type:complete
MKKLIVSIAFALVSTSGITQTVSFYEKDGTIMSYYDNLSAIRVVIGGKGKHIFINLMLLDGEVITEHLKLIEAESFRDGTYAFRGIIKSNNKKGSFFTTIDGSAYLMYSDGSHMKITDYSVF